MPLLLLATAPVLPPLSPVYLLGWAAGQPAFHNYETLTAFAKAQAQTGVLYATPDVFAAALQSFETTIEVVPWLR